MTNLETVIDWAWKRFPNQPVRVAQLVRILCGKEKP
jgi:hypothetical protein